MTARVGNTLTLSYDIKAGRRESLADIEDFRAYCGLTDNIMDDSRVGKLLSMAYRRIRALTAGNIDGTANKEKLGRSDGRKRDYYTLFKPVLHTRLDVGGEVTKAPMSIRVYTHDRHNSEAYTLVDHSSFSFNGETGHVIFKPTDVPHAGLDIYVSYFYDNTLFIQAQMALAASWAFAQLSPTENRDSRPAHYMKEFETIMHQFVGEDHAYFATRSEQQREQQDVSRSYVEQL
jgi:hypothetical protein